METDVKRMAIDDGVLVDAFSRMVCVAFCAGLAVSAVAGGLVLLIAGTGG